jgi:hypothetical protein
VYLKVSPMKGVKRFGMKGKFAPRHIGPFPILEKCGTVEYKLELPPSLAGVHGIFHASHLKKYLKALMDVVLLEVTPLEADLTYPKHPIKILDQKDRVTRCKTVKFFKVQWTNHSKEETMWESEDFILAIQSLSYRREESCDCSLFLLGPFSFSYPRMRFVSRGRAVTPLMSL